MEEASRDLNKLLACYTNPDFDDHLLMGLGLFYEYEPDVIHPGCGYQTFNVPLAEIMVLVVVETVDMVWCVL